MSQDASLAVQPRLASAQRISAPLTPENLQKLSQDSCAKPKGL